MRIEEICFERYGAFSGRSIALPADKPVTVVHGANEAGKTTALSGVVDLLYGIEVRTTLDFLHAKKDMRLSGTLAAGDASISFRRLKRAQRTLVDRSTDLPLPDDALAPFLGATDRAGFLSTYGLDRERLRQGGRALLAGGGDLAHALIAAAPGLAGLLATRDRLTEEAAGFHNHLNRVGNNELKAATAARDAARRAVREGEVRVDEVKRLRGFADDADKARDDAVLALASARMEVKRLDLLQRASREIVGLDRLLERRGSLGRLPDLSARGLADARETMRLLRAARDAHATCEAEMVAAGEALAAIEIDARVLAADVSIEAMDERRAVVTEGLADLPKRLEELGAMRGDLDRIAAALGVDGPDAVRSGSPSGPTLARAEALVVRMGAAEREGVYISEQERRNGEARERVEAEVARVGPAPDPRDLRERIDGLDGCEDRAAAAKQARRGADNEARRLDAMVARTAFGAADLAGLLALFLPAVTVARKRHDSVGRSEAALRSIVGEVRQLIAEVGRAEARVAAFKAPGDVPTAAAVEEARRVRDGTWARVRPALLGERTVDGRDSALAADFEERSRTSDDVADERWAAADRAAALLQAEVALADVRASLTSASEAEADARSAEGRARGEWLALWLPVGIEAAAADGDDLIERLRAAHDAVHAGDRLAELREDERRKVLASDEDARRLHALAAEAGVPEAEATVTRLRTLVAEMQRRFQHRTGLERDRQGCDGAARTIEARRAALADERRAVEAEASEVLPALSVRSRATTSEAKAALAAWREAVATLPNAGQLERRVTRIREESDLFDAAAADLVASVAPELTGTGAAAAVKAIRARLDRARQARSRAEDAIKAASRRTAACERAAEVLRYREGAAGSLAATLDVSDEDGALAVLDRVAEAHVMDASVAEARARLGDVLEGRPEAEVRAEIGTKDPVALVGERALAETKAAAAQTESETRIEERVVARAKLTEIDDRAGAARAAQDEADAVAAMAAAADGFARSHVAARLLSVAIDRYRERHQSPIVRRAGEGFALLTDGRWDGLGIDYGEENPTLRPTRNGKPEKLTALSEGTADQLFLALRVAAIQEHASTNRPLPFIADDLFGAFDEDRTEAGLRLLGRLGETTQVVVFTHHAYVVERARKVLAERAEIVSL